MYKPLDKGRYYRFFVESNGSAYSLTDADIEEATISSTYLMLPKGYKVLDTVYDVTSTTATAANMSSVIRFGSDGAQGVALPPKANMTDAYIYIYAVKD